MTLKIFYLMYAGKEVINEMYNDYRRTKDLPLLKKK